MERIPEFIGNHLFLVSLFMALLIMLLWNLFGAAMTGVAEVAHGEATRLINREGALILDVREVGEYQTGHIIDAVNIPMADLDGRRGELEAHRDRPVIAVCASGPTAARAVRLLRGAGFPRAVALSGGLAAWKAAHLPLTRAQDN